MLPHTQTISGRMKYLTLTDPKKVWMPDTFFRNEKTGHFHNILVNNVYIRVFPNGDVLYSIRVSSFALLLLINYFPTSEPKNTKKDLICKIHKTYLHRT